MNHSKIIFLLTLCILFNTSLANAEIQGEEVLVVPEITKPPEGVQTMWPFYKPTKYIHIEKFDIHVLGTETVSDWMMEESSVLIYNMVAGLKNREDQRAFRGHQAFIITDHDPDLSKVGASPGHRNTGGKGFSLFNEAIVCTKAVDTIRPNGAPVYRAWDTPVHEFAHAIEHTLELESKSDQCFKTHVSQYNPKVAREYFSWATQLWYSSDRVPSLGRQSMPEWQYEFLAEIFNESQVWLPSQAPRPEITNSKSDGGGNG